eukprot:CAMPEP_0197191668 /NCGR_PEP_ID=MMETSP1423-20130617/23763_1 /TAXON_ID=476441 /ORGANISM="Pseudo-nitzschia heimii, Strain UNC1101" /LENGTH=735 /DNA_ID=CAMNT_0042644367 /DNA_START=18 /DNA_END=2228 /DNA_ORIENTATION=+
MNDEVDIQEQAMIITDTVKAVNETMEDRTSFLDEQIAHSDQKSTYSKRSNVVGLWRKREEAIKASKEKSRENRFEEEKEGNQNIEHDARQSHAIMSHDSKAEGSKRNQPELNTTKSSDENLEDGKIISANAPRRANIRDSWKKRAANIPSSFSQRIAENGDKTTETIINANDSAASPQSKNSFRADGSLGDHVIASATDSTGLPTSAKRSSIRNSWRKRETSSPRSSSSLYKEEKNESDKVQSMSDKVHVPMNNQIAESSAAASTSAFDELKSKWAKFGVQKEDEATMEGETEKDRKGKESETDSFLQSTTTAESPIKDSSKVSASKIEVVEKSSLDNFVQEGAKEDAKEDSKGSGSLSSRVLASKRMSSKRFRSKYGRRSLSASSMDESDSENNVTNPTATKPSPGHNEISIEKELVPSFPLDETNQNESNLHSKSKTEVHLQKTKSNLCHSFIPIQSHFRDSEPQNTSPLSKYSSIHKGNFTSHQDNINEVDPTRSDSYGVDAPNEKDETIESHNHKNSNLSRSSLSSRANKRLRDIRMKNKTRREEDVENSSVEADINSTVGSSLSLRRTKTNESHGSSLLPMDEANALNQSSGTEKTRPNAQTQSTHAAFISTENMPFLGTKDDQRSPLHRVVPDANDMIPDEFVSEKNANVESFRTAYDRTSFEQIANDMREEASSIFGVNILNEGVQTAINKFGFGDMFQTKSPKKLAKRSSSPVEEVAIEVEYVADSD